MPKNHFKDSRVKIQKAFIDRDFLKPLVKGELPFEFVEKQHKKGDGKLRIVRVDNIPATDKTRPVSYILELELEGELFSLPPNYRTVEKAIILLTGNCVYVALVEMKSSVDSPTIRKIEEKIKHSIGRISLFLTHYLFDAPAYDDYRVKFYSFIFYNNDLLTMEITIDPTLEELDLVKIFQGKKVSAMMLEPLGETHKVKVVFKKNHLHPEEFDIDFNEFFKGDANYEQAIASDRTMPFDIV